MQFDKDDEDWELVAAGDQGYEVWALKFRVIENVVGILFALEEFSEALDFEALIGSQPYFASLNGIDLFDLGNLGFLEEYFDDFIVFTSDPENDDAPGQSFNTCEVYITRKRVSSILKEFAALLESLNKSDPLRKIGLV